MKTLFLIGSFLICALVSCEQPKPQKKYYIVVESMDKSIYGNGLEKKYDRDTVLVESDSAAFAKAVISYAAHLRTDKLLKEKGVVLSVTQGYDVYDENMNSIKYRVSERQQQWAESLIERSK